VHQARKILSNNTIQIQELKFTGGITKQGTSRVV
jgi:hypothetical protein